MTTPFQGSVGPTGPVGPTKPGRTRGPTGATGTAGTITGGTPGSTSKSIGYWLVKTGTTTAEIQIVIGGQRPRGTAIYLGPAYTDISKYAETAARRLGLPASAGTYAATHGPQSPTGDPTSGQGLGVVGDVGDAFGDVAGTIASVITSPLDFLKLIAWIFHPLNILRAVEFLTGIVLMLIGLYSALRTAGTTAVRPVKKLVRTLPIR